MPKQTEVKKKLTHYFTEKAEKQLKELYAFRYISTTEDVARSDIICEAINNLYEKTFKELNEK